MALSQIEKFMKKMEKAQTLSNKPAPEKASDKNMPKAIMAASTRP